MQGELGHFHLSVGQNIAEPIYHVHLGAGTDVRTSVPDMKIKNNVPVGNAK